MSAAPIAAVPTLPRNARRWFFVPSPSCPLIFSAVGFLCGFVAASWRTSVLIERRPVPGKEGLKATTETCGGFEEAVEGRNAHAETAISATTPKPKPVHMNRVLLPDSTF